MSQVRVGLLHPGEMGAAIGAELRKAGHDLVWASEGRSAATAARAEAAGLADVRTAAALAGGSDVILSICPPHAAIDVATEVVGFAGVYVDANAVSPATTRAIEELVAARGATFVDGGIVGGPPTAESTTSLYLSGAGAADVARLFEGTQVLARAMAGDVGAASAVKMTYAAWSKGTAALLLAIHAVAEAEGVAETLEAEWRESAPELPARLAAARRSADAKGWRWIAEMEEIAATFVASGMPEGFHLAAAEVYRRAEARAARGSRA